MRDGTMGMSLEDFNAKAQREAQQRRRRDGQRAQDRCIDDYLALASGDPRQRELTRVIAVLSMM